MDDDEILFEQCREKLREWRTITIKRYGEEIARVIECAWAAGFFDGEGSVGVRHDGGFNCEVTQVEDELINLVRFRDAVGVGRIAKAQDRSVTDSTRANHRPTRRWYVSNQTDLKIVWSQIGPFLNPNKRNGETVRRDGIASPPLDGFARALTIPIATAITKDKPLPENVASYEPPRRKPDRQP